MKDRIPKMACFACSELMKLDLAQKGYSLRTVRAAHRRCD